MAWRMRLKLPALKVTQRTETGVVHRSIRRGTKSDDAAAACTGDGCSGVEEKDAFDPSSESSFAATFEPSDASKGRTSDEPDEWA